MLGRASTPVPALVLRALTLVPIVLGALVLLGWMLDVEALRYLSPLSDQPQVKANTAVCIVLLAIALGLVTGRPMTRRRRSAAQALSVVVLAVAVLTLAEHALGIDVGIDQLLVQESAGAVRTPHLGRMATNTALALLLLAVAVLAFEVRWRGRRPANLLAIAVGAMAVLALDGIVLGTDGVPLFSQYARMAGATAIALVLLALAVVLARNDTATARLLTAQGPAGLTARRLMPAIVIMPAVLGYLRLEGQERGLYGLEFGTWVLVVALTATFAVVAWRLVRRLDAEERRSGDAEAKSLAALREAERANAAKSEFISRMSHELRTPMNSILGFAQLMEMDGVADAHREHVGHILSSGRHLLELINEILDLSRIEAGKLTISSEAVRLSTTVAECVALMEPLAHERRITLAVRPGPGDAHVIADHQRLRQVLLNLLANAVKFNTPDGRVTVSWAESGDTTRISVRDTGIGIPADRLSGLFVPFDRVGAENSDEEGTGLGLALSQRLVQLMGGSIVVADEPEGGTTFTVALARTAPPRAIPSTDVPSASAPRALDLQNLRVVYVEDNLVNLRLVEALLEPRGATIESAGTVVEGLRLVTQQDPDVVLLDLHLPDGSGLDVLKQLKGQPATASIPVVMLTADATTISRRRAYAHGAYGYLPKPLDVDLLLGTLAGVNPSAEETLISATE